MFLKLMYITNNPAVALIAEKYGVDRIWIDLETLGKKERQKNIDSVKSNHKIEDVIALSKILTKSELMVRVNPWNDGSEEEIAKVIDYGAQRIMLPMWKTKEETDKFLNLIHGRVHTSLLLETKEAVECVDEVLLNDYIDEIHIGLNDLHLSYGLTFMFELLANGVVDSLCKKFQKAGIPYGFGGIARLGEGLLSSEMVITEHYRLGSTRAILSRSFCNAEIIRDNEIIDSVFCENMKALRDFEETFVNKDISEFEKNRVETKRQIANIVEKMKRGA